MVPLWVSASAMVSGILSLFLSTLIITKLPALRLFAMRGASISNLNTFSENCCFCIILFMLVSGFDLTNLCIRFLLPCKYSNIF